MILIFQRFLARRYLCWAIAILALIGAADYSALKTPPKDIYLTSVAKSQEDMIRYLGIYDKKIWVEHKDGTRGWMEDDQILTTEKMEELKEYKLSRTDRGYYFTSAEAIEQKCIGHSFETIDGHYRMATEIIKKKDGSMEANYDKIASLRPDGAFYQTLLCFNEEGICNQVTFGKKIKDRNCLLLKHLPGVQTIMGWDWLTWHVQEGLYTVDNKYISGVHAWYTYTIIIIGYAIAVTMWAIAPLFLPLLLLLSCFLFPLPHYIRIIIKVLSPILLIASAYIWMIAMLSWGYPWLIGLPIGCGVVFVTGFGLLMTFFDNGGKKEYWKKSDAEVLELIRPIIANQFVVDDWEITPQTKLGEDLGCDVFDLLDIIKKTQEELGVELPYKKFVLERIKTVRDLVHIIKKYS